MPNANKLNYVCLIVSNLLFSLLIMFRPVTAASIASVSRATVTRCSYGCQKDVVEPMVTLKYFFSVANRFQYHKALLSYEHLLPRSGIVRIGGFFSASTGREIYKKLTRTFTRRLLFFFMNTNVFGPLL